MRTVRLAVQSPSDPELVKLFQKLAPHCDWARYQAGSSAYEPPRWIGYWSAHEVAWASDGLLKVILPNQEHARRLFRQIEASSFARSPRLPFVGEGGRDPSHMLLHDTHLSQLELEPFEQAEARLVHQVRP